jgi:hypothetical protein
MTVPIAKPLGSAVRRSLGAAGRSLPRRVHSRRAISSTHQHFANSSAAILTACCTLGKPLYGTRFSNVSIY